MALTCPNCDVVLADRGGPFSRFKCSRCKTELEVTGKEIVDRTLESTVAHYSNLFRHTLVRWVLFLFFQTLIFLCLWVLVESGANMMRGTTALSWPKVRGKLTEYSMSSRVKYSYSVDGVAFTSEQFSCGQRAPRMGEREELGYALVVKGGPAANRWVSVFGDRS